MNILILQIFTSNQSKFVGNKKGFTLIELLISVSLLGLVMTLVYGSFFQISNYTQLIKSNQSLREELRLLMKIVLDDLQNIQYLKNFPRSEKGADTPRETGLIAERKLGLNNSEKGEIEEFSVVNFHSATQSLFFPMEKYFDPEIHEIGYSLEEDTNTKIWNFLRREDFYLDNNMKEGGKIQIISQSVTKFDIEFLESETELAGGGYIEKWAKKWNSNENKCLDTSIQENFCLPRAIKLTMELKGKDERTDSDSQVANICIPPCDPEIFR